VDLLEQTHKAPRTLTQQLGLINESGKEAKEPNKGVPANGMMGMAPRDARREYEDGLNMLVAVLIISVSAVYVITTINPFPHLYEPEPPPPPPTLVESWTARVASFFRPPPGLGTVPVKL
jgi:hypothetical protein